MRMLTTLQTKHTSLHQYKIRLRLLRLVDIVQVLIVNDRLALDQQLGDCVCSFLAANGVPPSAVLRANDTAALQRALDAPIGSEARPQVRSTAIVRL